MKKALAIVPIVLVCALAGSVQAGTVLSKEDAQALFNNMTFDGHNEKKDRDFKVFSGPDGQHIIHSASGKVKERFWRINDKGEHCVTRKQGANKNCAAVVDQGDGVYHKVKGGQHTHTLSNFRAGNNL